jgi:Flp pilus assembly pilin Flp
MALRSGVLAKLRRGYTGQTLTEYSLIVFFVGITAYAAYTGIGLGVKAFTNNVLSFISTAVAAL